MSDQLVKNKSVALVFRGFDCSVGDVESLMGRLASRKGHKGENVRPGVKARLIRSYVIFSIELESSSRLYEVIPRILEEVGGEERIVKVKKKVRPEFIEVDIVWPIKKSIEQEGGFISNEDLAALAKIGCTLSFSFL